MNGQRAEFVSSKFTVTTKYPVKIRVIAVGEGGMNKE
jgi:hypothetical protein